MINHSDKKVKPKICSYISHQLFKGRIQNIQKIVSLGFWGGWGSRYFQECKTKEIKKKIAKGTMDPGVGCCKQSGYSAYFTHFTCSAYSAMFDCIGKGQNIKTLSESVCQSLIWVDYDGTCQVRPRSDKNKYTKTVRLKWTFDFMTI